MRTRSRLYGCLCIAAVTVAMPSAAQVQVYVAYAENERPPVYFPNPWVGSSDTTFLGHTGPDFDTGAILFRNTGSADLVLGPGAVVDNFTDGASFQLWDGLIGTGVVIHANTNLILAATASSNFDSSDHPITGVYSPIQPHIHITLGGTPRAFIDTAQVLNTGGFDAGEFLNGGTNESMQWRLIGTTGIEDPAGTGIVASVPEPGALSILAVALAGLCVTIHRRRISAEI